jgi:hypothetical protein
VDHCCSLRVYWGSCCSICRFTTQIYRLSNRNPNKHGANNNGPQNTTHKSTD